MTRNLTVTLTTTGVVYDLFTLILANTEIAAETAADVIFPAQVAQLIIQAIGGLINLVDWKADANLGPDILAGESESFGPGNMNVIDLRDFKLKADTDATKAKLTIIAV